MKKYLKIVLAFCLIFVLSAFLCGCADLDGLRARQGFYKSEDTVIFGDTEYKYLTTRDTEMEPFYSDNTERIQITEEDVPVLLIDMFGDSARISEDKKFIGTDSALYCRTDCYEEMEERLKIGFIPDTYCYQYFVPTTGKASYYILSDAEKDAINNLVASVEATTLPDGVSITPLHQVRLFLCSKDLLFRTASFQIFVTDNSTYYLIDQTESGRLIYTVPDHQKSIFEGIMAAATVNKYDFAIK